MGRAESNIGSTPVRVSGALVIAVTLACLAALGAIQAPVGAQSEGPMVTLVVGRARGVSTADVADALAGVAAGPARSVADLDATTVAVPAAEVDRAADQLDTVADYVQPSVTYHAAALTPVDPEYGMQGELTQIDAPDAWAQTTGGGTVVAVVDSGIVPGPDLTDSIGTSIVPGYDEVDLDSDPTDVPSGASDWSSHGTLVASVLAARANTFGIVGTCPGCKIMPIRALGSDGSGSDVDIAKGIQYATNHGANVINLSLGGAESNLVDTAIDQARAQGIVVVAAAGNSGSNIPLTQDTAAVYPAAHPGVLSVASTCSPTAFANSSTSCTGESDGELATFTGRGASWVDVAAPGVAYATEGTGLYLFTGTSASTPFVSGVVAMVHAAHPSWTEAQIRAAVTQTAAPVTPAGEVAGGEVRAGSAVALGVAPVVASPPTAPVVAANPADVTPPSGTMDPLPGYLHDVATAVVHASDDRGVASVVLVANGQSITSLQQVAPGTWASWWNTALVPDGPVSLTAIITDGAGNRTVTAPVGGAVDNQAPTIHLIGPPNGSVVSKSFGVAAFTSDAGSGVRLTLVAAGGQVVGGSAAPVGALALVPLRRRGTLVVVAAAVDGAGHVAFSNAITVSARPGRH